MFCIQSVWKEVGNTSDFDIKQKKSNEHVTYFKIFKEQRWKKLARNTSSATYPIVSKRDEEKRSLAKFA